MIFPLESKESKAYSLSVLLKETLFVSTLCFLIADLLARILANGWYSLGMLAYGIPFQDGLVWIDHGTRSLAYWSESNILVIYGLGGVLMAVAGSYLMSAHLFRKSGNWFVKLLLLWLPFQLLGGLVGQVITSVLVPNGLGHAIEWIFPGRMERAIVAVLAMVAWIMSTRFWAGRFLMAASSELLIRDVYERKDYITTVMTFSWLGGMLISSLIDLPFVDVYEILSHIVMGIVTFLAMFQYPLVGYIKIQDTLWHGDALRPFYLRALAFIIGIMALKNALLLFQ